MARTQDPEDGALHEKGRAMTRRDEADAKGAAARTRGVPDRPRGASVDPRFRFTVSVAPVRFVASLDAGWDGALLTEGDAGRDGEARHDHEVVTVGRWFTPNDARPFASPRGWTTLPPGVRLCLPGDREHAEWRGQPRCQFLFIAPERVEAVLGTPWDRSGLARWREPRHALPFVESVMAAMMADLEAGHPAGPLVGDSLLVSLLTHLHGAVPAAPRRGALGRRVERVREYIEANLASPLSVSELARVAGIGPRRFGAIFAAETGASPHQFVLRRRVERAKALMRDPTRTLAEIGRAVGFRDPGQFSRVFRQHAGETARAYRQH
jgi:AraC family transcriptional regulator